MGGGHSRLPESKSGRRFMPPDLHDILPRSESSDTADIWASKSDGDWRRFVPPDLHDILPRSESSDTADRSALASKTFESASKSDGDWRRFVPPDLHDILSRSDTEVQLTELYFRLCHGILIDGRKLSFSVDKMTGKKCFMLSARELTITWGDSPEYWTWNHHPRSRFAEVAVLENVCWLEICGRINSRMLPPNAIYAAYLVMGYNENVRGLKNQQAHVSVKLGNQVSSHTAYLENKMDPRNMLAHARIPQTRSDGWVEIELGDCYIDEGDEGEVEMKLLGIDGESWKYGIIIECIEMRPKV